MVRWIVGSILHGGHIEVFLGPASAQPWYMLFCLCDNAYKRALAAKNERVAHEATAGFLSSYMCGPLPYV